jgi:hypothetical protein
MSIEVLTGTVVVELVVIGQAGTNYRYATKRS